MKPIPFRILRYGFDDEDHRLYDFNKITEEKVSGTPLKITERILNYFRKEQKADSVLELLQGNATPPNESQPTVKFGAKLGADKDIDVDIFVITKGLLQSVDIGIKSCLFCKKPGDQLIALNQLIPWFYCAEDRIKELLLVSNAILGTEHKHDVESISAIKDDLRFEKNQLNAEINETCQNCKCVQEILKSVIIKVQ